MTHNAATIRPLHPPDRYVGLCGICNDLVLLTHYDPELPLGSGHLCSACCAFVITADVLLNTRLPANGGPLARPPRGCEADGHHH